MNFFSLQPGHAKKARNFQTRAEGAMGSIMTLGERQVFIAAERDSQILTTTSHIGKMRKKDKSALVRELDRRDIDTATRTVIGILATCDASNILVGLVDHLDALGKTWGALPHDGSVRIFENDDYDNFGWILKTFYTFK